MAKRLSDPVRVPDRETRDYLQDLTRAIDWALRDVEDMANQAAGWFKFSDNGSVTITTGLGSPEGVVPAGKGSLYLRQDGAVSDTLYVKTSGSAETGWTAK